MDGSLDSARGAGGGSRVKVGDVAWTLDLPSEACSTLPETESLFTIAAGAVGGDLSGTCTEVLTEREESSCR